MSKEFITFDYPRSTGSLERKEIKDSDWLFFLCFMPYWLCKSLCFGFYAH